MQLYYRKGFLSLVTTHVLYKSNLSPIYEKLNHQIQSSLPFGASKSLCPSPAKLRKYILSKYTFRNGYGRALTTKVH